MGLNALTNLDWILILTILFLFIIARDFFGHITKTRHYKTVG